MPDYTGGRIYFTADSDSIITKGIKRCLYVLSGRTPQEIINVI